jgi:hypothetical protein
MVPIQAKIIHGQSYYPDLNPYPGDDEARLNAVCDVHEYNPRGGFNLRGFEVVRYTARGPIEAVWTKTTFERVR